MSLRAHVLPQGPVPQRRNRRFPVRLWAVERSGEGRFHHAVTNLSASGMFLAKSLPIPVGTTLHVELPLPTGRTIRGLGTVVHATATASGPGNGVALSRMLESDREVLCDYLAHLPLC